MPHKELQIPERSLRRAERDGLCPRVSPAERGKRTERERPRAEGRGPWGNRPPRSGAPFAGEVPTTSGYALLSAVLILAAVTLGVAVAGSLGTPASSTPELLLLRARAESLAGACAEIAILELGRSDSYGGNATITIGSESCAIRPIVSNPTTWTVETIATVASATVRLRVLSNRTTPITLRSWAAVAGF